MTQSETPLPLFKEQLENEGDTIAKDQDLEKKRPSINMVVF
jgi:hypothetical protein